MKKADYFCLKRYIQSYESRFTNRKQNILLKNNSESILNIDGSASESSRMKHSTKLNQKTLHSKEKIFLQTGKSLKKT